MKDISKQDIIDARKEYFRLKKELPSFIKDKNYQGTWAKDKHEFIRLFMLNKVVIDDNLYFNAIDNDIDQIQDYDLDWFKK